jgi:O-acetylserine/cysteine efflux transporter
VKPRHVALAVLVAFIWGVAFVMTRLALDAFSPPQLTALRFAIAGLPALFVPRPRVPWRSLIAVGLTLFTGQFLFQFFGIAHGMPPGLAAVVVQTQAFFTILFAALALSERPSGRQLAGMGMALAGVLAIATTLGHDLTATGLGLTVLSAVSWGIGNVLVKRLGHVEVFRLVVWLSLVPVLPSLALSAWVDGAAALAPIGTQTTWIGLGAALYLGVVATVIGYAIWGDLLRRYPTPVVAPFALLAPFVAGLGSSLAFGERFGAPRLVGMALVLLGLAVIVLPGSARPPE